MHLRSTELEGELEHDQAHPKIYPDAMIGTPGLIEGSAEAEIRNSAAEHFLPLIGNGGRKRLPLAAKRSLPMAREPSPDCQGRYPRHALV